MNTTARLQENKSPDRSGSVPPQAATVAELQQSADTIRAGLRVRHLPSLHDKISTQNPVRRADLHASTPQTRRGTPTRSGQAAKWGKDPSEGAYLQNPSDAVQIHPFRLIEISHLIALPEYLPQDGIDPDRPGGGSRLGTQENHEISPPLTLPPLLFLSTAKMSSGCEDVIVQN